MTTNQTVGVAEMLRTGSSGYAARMARESYRRRVAEAWTLFGRASQGDRYARLEFHDLMGGVAREGRVNEALSTSDFPILFGDALNRSLARRYTQRPTVWQRFAARQTVRDFRATKIVEFLGGSAVLDEVPELDEYKARAFAESSFSTTTGKRGNRLMWSWEMMINDDLGAFDTAPDALSRGARNTEDYLATSVLVSSTGPKSWLGTAASDALTRENLEKGLQAVMDASDEDDNPIVIDTPVLMVPRALALTAQNIVNTTEIQDTSSSKRASINGNGLSATPEIVVNDWLTRIDESDNAKTTWYLLPSPTSTRPAVYQTFLAGHEAPDLRVKADAGMRLGGGMVPADEGSFERDAVEYRIRHVVKGNQGFDDAVYVSKGSA